MKQITFRIVIFLTIILFSKILPAQTEALKQVYISEIHYDNIGIDVGEFVEIASMSGFSLDGWSLELIQGNPNVASFGTAYVVYPLAGYGDTDVSSNKAMATTVVNTPGIQNGSPDGIVLRKPNGTIHEFISYDGTFDFEGISSTPITSGNGTSGSLVSENGGTPIGTSIQQNGFGAWFSEIIESRNAVNVNVSGPFSGNLNTYRQSYQVWFNNTTNDWTDAHNWDTWDIPASSFNTPIGVFNESIVNIISGNAIISTFLDNGTFNPTNFSNAYAETIIGKLNLLGGTLTISFTGRLDINNEATVNGNLILDGEINVTNDLTINGGISTLNSNNIAVGNFINDGTIDIGATAQAIITGNFQNTDEINFHINGGLAGNPTGYQKLDVIGDIDLSGSLNVIINPAYLPTDGTSHTIISYTGALSGTFVVVNIISTSGWYIDYSTTGEVNIIRDSVLNVEDVDETDFTVYPNPVSEYISIDSKIEIDKIELFDLLGKQVISTNQTLEINVSHLPVGVYLLRIISESGKITKKIIIE